MENEYLVRDNDVYRRKSGRDIEYICSAISFGWAQEIAEALESHDAQSTSAPSQEGE